MKDTRIKRLDSLDYLRGLMAISIMAYHYVSWSVFEPNINSLLGKLGIYAVSIFYILSGLSLSYVYFCVGKEFSLKEFVIKRVFRIVPIFWLCITVALTLRYIESYFISGELYKPEWIEVLLNYTLLFGFVMPDKYISVGTWSIGNEVVFYSMFPIIIYSCIRFGKFVAACWLLMSIGIGCYFCYFSIDENQDLLVNWHVYVNPLNQVFLFVSGICIAMFFKPTESTSFRANCIYTFTLFFLVVLFIYYPVGNRSVDLIIGGNRVILSFLSILIVLNVYIYKFSVTGFIGSVLLFFGRCCYSIYLIHPIVALPLAFVLHDKLGVNVVVVYVISAVITLISSAVIYERIEKPMMNFGKELVNKNKLCTEKSFLKNGNLS